MRKTIAFVVLLFSCSAFAQDKLSVIQQAMRDELERNMKELKSDGFEKPFFINYSLLDATTFQATATLGALMQSTESKARTALSIRLLVGDYDFNDESLDNNLFSQPRANEIELPIDDDYLGIRRSLWISTDNVYRNASRQFAKNKEMLKEQNKPLAEVPHRSFEKVSPSKISIEAPEVKFDRKATEDYIRKVSAVFAEYSEITASNVNFYYTSGYRYLVNSEGSTNKVPAVVVQLSIDAAFQTTSGEFIFDEAVYRYSTPQLPPVETMMENVKKMASALVVRSKAPAFHEEYIGPVLFEGDFLAQTISDQLFSGEDNLIANNNIPSLKGLRYEPTNSMDTKVGKAVFAEGMTLKATPKLKKYGDQELFGSFEVDDEGVVPADETVLIENGVLKALLNDRTNVKPDQVANGFGAGPGVVSISFRNTIPESSMKAKLIEQAKKEGLEYALIVKHGLLMGQQMGLAVMANVYKIYVADGREELVRQTSVKHMSQRNFRKVIAASKETGAYHVTGIGSIISVIGPKAIIFEEVEVGTSDMPTMKEEEYVPSPLKK